jgi:hypothetical protein
MGASEVTGNDVELVERLRGPLTVVLASLYSLVHHTDKLTAENHRLLAESGLKAALEMRLAVRAGRPIEISLAEGKEAVIRLPRG